MGHQVVYYPENIAPNLANRLRVIPGITGNHLSVLENEPPHPSQSQLRAREESLSHVVFQIVVCINHITGLTNL